METLNKTAKLSEKVEALIKLGFMAHIVNGEFIHVNGKNKKDFNAKQKKANSITRELNNLPFISVAWDKLAYGGFYDFYAK